MGFLELQRQCGVSHVVRGAQGASHVALGKSGLHAHCEGELRIALESLQGKRDLIWACVQDLMLLSRGDRDLGFAWHCSVHHSFTLLDYSLTSSLFKSPRLISSQGQTLYSSSKDRIFLSSQQCSGRYLLYIQPSCVLLWMNCHYFTSNVQFSSTL